MFACKFVRFINRFCVIWYWYSSLIVAMSQWLKMIDFYLGSLSQLIQPRRLRFFGHVARMDTSLEHSRCQSEGCPRVGGVFPGVLVIPGYTPRMQISSLTILASAQHGNTLRIENIGSTSWKLLHSSLGHAHDVMMMSLGLHFWACCCKAINWNCLELCCIGSVVVVRVKGLRMIVCVQVDKNGRHKRLASEPINLTQFVSVTPLQTQLTIEFHTLSKKISSASLTLTLSSLFLCDGNATYVQLCFVWAALQCGFAVSAFIWLNCCVLPVVSKSVSK